MSSAAARGGFLLLAAAIGVGAATFPVNGGAQAPKRLTFSILEDYDKGDDLAEVARDFDLFHRVGISTWRGSFGWDDYEPARGRYEFGWLHDFMTLAAQKGIELRPYVAYTPEWAAGGRDRDGEPWNQPPRDLAAWSAFVSALGRELRHHPNVQSLEIYNEENVAQWWEGTADLYARTLTAARAQIPRRALPLLMGGLVYPDVNWIDQVCGQRGAPGAFDIVAVHAYPETWTPPDVTVENYLGPAFRSGFIAAVDRRCGRKPIWINETGFATTAGKSESDQAAWWVRAVATFAAEPRVEHIGVYEIKDLRHDRPAIGDTPNYHLGLTRADRSPKLAFSTVRALVDLLGGGAITTDDTRLQVSADGAGLFHHGFVREDGDAVLVLWNRERDDDVKIVIPAPWRNVVEVRLDGTTAAIPFAEPFDIHVVRGTPRIFRLSRSRRTGGENGRRGNREKGRKGERKKLVKDFLIKFSPFSLLSLSPLLPVSPRLPFSRSPC